MILVDKQLKRPDGGIVPSGSFIEYKSSKKGDKYKISMQHFINKEKSFRSIPCVNDFKYIIFIDSNKESDVKDYIDSCIGRNYTKII